MSVEKMFALRQLSAFNFWSDSGVGNKILEVLPTKSDYRWKIQIRVDFRDFVKYKLMKL